MTKSESDSERFEALSRELLNSGFTVRFEARGASMSPCIRDGEIVHVTAVIVSKLRKGDIVLTKGHSGFRVHRLVALDHDKNLFITRGDCGQQDDPPVRADQILGVVASKEVRLGEKIVTANLNGFTGKLLQGAARVQYLAGKFLRIVCRSHGNTSSLIGAFVFSAALLVVPSSRAQVVVDTSPSTNATADLTGAGTKTLTFNHTTSATANRVLLVGVSMNIANSTATAVSGVTYNGTALTLLGAHNDAGNTRRVEQWYLLNPASGTTLPIIVSVDIPSAATVGVAAGATVFTGVDQTVPLGSMVSGNGAAASYSELDVPSVINGMVFDTLAVGMGAITVPGPQVAQWNITSGGTTPNASEDVASSASSRTGAPNVPVSESFNETLNLTSVVPDATTFNLTSVAPSTTTFNLTSVAPTKVVLTLTAVANAAGGDTVYTGTITGGAGNAYVGDTVVIAGFTGLFAGLDNGTFTCTASSATTITLNNANGVAQTHAATATVTTNTVYTGTITGGVGNVFAGDSVIVAGFNTAANNGTFVATASTATTLTLSNKAGVAETDPGTAKVATAVYTGTITGGAANAFLGDSVVISGFTNAPNNGTYVAIASTATTLTLNNTAAVAETDTATAAVENGSSDTVYTGTITGGTGNGFAGDTFTMAGFTNAGNNGTFTCTASTATTLTCNNTTGVSETKAGTATTSNTLNWSEAAVSINPTTADIAVTTSVASAVFLGQTTTYNITVTNNGPSAANTVQLTDTLATGMTWQSTTPSPGTTCTGTTTITCNLPASFASGATATISVVGKATASGSYANTATITDSNTPPDPNTGNNTYVAVATVQALACGTVSQAAPGTNLGGVLNTYYPGTASVAAGATSITVGAATGAGSAIAVGNLLLVIQMQDASINDSNTVAYGNGYTGQGFTQLNSAGSYEFVTAQSAVGTGGGTVTISGAGLGGGLVFSYHSSAWSAAAGQSTFQVIVVPQYAAASFNATTPPTAPAWNGSTGGVLVLDTSGTLSLNGATLSMDGLGFRGGAGLQLGGGGGSKTDFQQPAPATYTPTGNQTTTQVGWDANKGEGIAGTPAWVESGGTYLATGTGYPSGTSGTDGSMARGAAGNAGAGGTDGDPQTAPTAGNDQNAGGGGGANGGAGGFGGDTWSTNLSSGGEGGTVFPATINRVALGGGGGAGSRNNTPSNTQASGGAAGGGIIIIRTYALSGTAILTANGINAYNGTLNDAGGGGGAGGSIVVLSANGGESGLTLQANGGNGGNAWEIEPFSLANRHGPGGGGGGGVVLISGAPASISLNGGANGLTENPGVAYGSTPGAAGTSVTNASISQTSGIQSGAQCTPDMTLGKSHVGNFTRGSTATYTIPVENLSPFGSTSGTVTVNDTMPAGLTPTSAAGTGWTCSIASQTVSCINSSVLAANSFYPSITVNANVLQTAPSTETNTALVSGGGEVNLANDSATDVANVISTADLSITNAASPDPVAAGSNVTYTQLLTNIGPSAADNATVVEAVPANTTFVSMSAPAGWNCTTPAVGNTGNITCTILNMAGSTAATFSLVTKVTAGTPNGTVITNTATASSSVSDPNSSNNTASASTVVGSAAVAELTVTNTASPNGVAAASNITYTQVVTNAGSIAATTATFTEATPANTTFVSVSAGAAPGWTCTSPPVSCTNPSVAAGASGTIVAVYKVIAGTPTGTIITDTATVNAANQTGGAASATATDTVTAATSQADLALSTASTPLFVFAGNDITYVQTITNSGPSAATTVSFQEAVPTNTTFASVSAPAGWTCTTPAVGSTGNISCTDPSLAASTSAAIIVVVNVAASDTTSPIAATSSVSAANSLTSTTNTSTPVTAACDIAVTNSGLPSQVQAANTITYTQTVTNIGPSNCANVTFNEAIPANTTFSTYSGAPAGWTCPSFAAGCTNPSFAPGTVSTFTVVVTVNAGTAAGTIISDTDTVTTTTHDTNQNNNSATVNIPVAGATQADLSVTNSASPNPVTAGGTITYTQTVTNNGPAAATTITLTETTPANTTAQSLVGLPGWTCTLGTLTCTISTLAANASASFTFTVTVNSNAASGSTITQTDSVSCTASDPTCANNTASASVLVGNSADLSVTNSASPVPVQASNNITYTQVVTNSGPSTATSATFTEITPANTTFASIGTLPAGWSCTTPSVGSAGTINCTNPAFAAGSASFSIAVGVNAGTAAGTAINDTVTVSSATSDPNSANNSATAADVVALSTQSDLITTNTAAPSSVAVGANITYTQSVTNNGPAAATTATFTQTTPPNTNYQSITAPAGWTCTHPAVGAAGTITCTDSVNFALNAVANFSLVLQVNAGTASGTNISESATASAGNIVPSLTSNTASATVVVANASSTTLTISKSASPTPTVSDGDTLTYTIQITNNGPASATNVTVTDQLPTDLTYLSSTPISACSNADGTVTCLLGTIAYPGNATVTISTQAGAPGIVTNTASVVADQMPTPATASQTEIITAPTSIQLESFTAQLGKNNTGANRVVLLWKTGREVHNLGFNIYREQGGERVRLNPSLIAGSALLMNSALPKHSGKTYTWIDSSPSAGSGPYWLEDIDVNGTRILHGPVSAIASVATESAGDSTSSSAALLNQSNQTQPVTSPAEPSQALENISPNSPPTLAQQQKQFEIASNFAVKIFVQREGWYRITQPELIAAGLDPNVDPAFLHLYAEALEQPLQIAGASNGPGGFGPQAAIYFYGTGIDTQYSGTRVYFLTAEESRGARIPRLSISAGSNQPPVSFPFTVELAPRTTYFSALTTADGNNFFGPFISSTPTDQTIQVSHLDATSAEPAQFDLILQGVILGAPHDVAISVNGTSVGDLTFTGQDKGTIHIVLPLGILQEGANTVTLTSQNGEYDYSLLQSIRVTYPHSYIVDSNKLIFTARPGEQVKLSGFTQSKIAVLDITDPTQPVALTPQITPDPASKSNYAVEMQVPWSTTNPSAPAQHTILAVSLARFSTASGIRRNHPSHWHSAQAGSEIVMVSADAFAGALAPLLRAHEAEGKSSAVALINDLYDEFSFGEHNPLAIRAFLQTAVNAWHTSPHYLLLNGRASFDPRNYLGFGNLDFVPTQIIATTGLMTASDDWFSDFTNTGLPTIATGRLPVSSTAESQLVTGKIVTYEGQSTNGPWTMQALMVADMNDTENFTKDSQLAQSQLPSSVQATDVFLSAMSVPDAQQAILTAINSGQLLVNYSGHGSEDEWSGDNLFNSTEAGTLTNGTSLPVFLIMDCLNGFFQDVDDEPLAVSLILAPNGGAVAVLASSGLNQAPPQTTLDKLVVQSAMGPSHLALGDAILKAKSGISDLAVRKTYNLLGDPVMKIKPPVALPAQ